MNEKPTTIRTSDLYFAAFLQSVGCRIEKTEQDGGKNIFYFVDDESRKNLKETYFNEDVESSVPALKLANNIRSLKTLCYVR